MFLFFGPIWASNVLIPVLSHLTSSNLLISSILAMGQETGDFNDTELIFVGLKHWEATVIVMLMKKICDLMSI